MFISSFVVVHFILRLFRLIDIYHIDILINFNFLYIFSGTASLSLDLYILVTYLLIVIRS